MEKGSAILIGKSRIQYPPLSEVSKGNPASTISKGNIQMRNKLTSSLLILILLSVSSLYSQVELDWNEFYGGTDVDYGQDIIAIDDGCYIMAGFTQSFGGEGNDYYLIKADGDEGDEIWARTFDSDNNDICNAVAQTADGGYAMAGYMEVYLHGYDFFLVKTDENGREEWSQRYDTESHDKCYDMIQTNDGGFLLGGAATVLPENRIVCIYVVKVDEDGEIEWTRRIECGTGDTCYKVIQAENGDYLLAGVYRNRFQGCSFERMSLIRLDSDGEILWEQRYNVSGVRANAVVQTRDNGFILVGSSTGPYLKYVKVDDKGELVWQRNLRSFSIGYDIIPVADGGYAIAGKNDENGYLLLKIDEDGEQEWLWSYGEVSNGARALAQAQDGGFVLVGERRFAVNREDVRLVKTEPENHFVSKGSPNFITQGFYLMPTYPNPFNHRTQINYRLTSPGFVRLTIYEPSGRRIETLFEGNAGFGVQSVVWDAFNTPAGTYFVKLEDGFGSVQTGKLMLLK